MKKYNKVISCTFVVFLLSSLVVRSDVAPNLLELSEGMAVIGDYNENGNSGKMTYSVENIWHDTFYDEDVIELKRDSVLSTPIDVIINISRYSIISIIIKNNRSVFMPVQKYLVESGDDTIIVFIDITDSLNSTIDNLKVTLNGVTYLFSDIDPESPLYSEIEIPVVLWLLGYIFGLSITPLTKYVISPQAAIGQYIDYGQYQGEVVGYTVYFINEKEYFEVIEVHHDEVIVNINFFGTIIPHTIGESILLYEKTSGLILSSLEYNSTSEEHYFFNATEVTGIRPLKTSVSFIVVLSTAIIAIPVILAKRKKK